MFNPEQSTDETSAPPGVVHPPTAGSEQPSAEPAGSDPELIDQT